jgi:hypothetical protein
MSTDFRFMIYDLRFEVMNVIRSTEPAAGIVAESPKRVDLCVAGLVADSPAAAQKKLRFKI